MSAQGVPWAEGRRALVWFDGTWSVGYGICDDGAREWLLQSLGGYDNESLTPAAKEGVATALLPNQCPRCYEVDGHADGCMVAANLARGVPAFWAPWAHFEEPAQTVATVYQWSGCDLVRMYDAADVLSEPIWRIDGGYFDGEAPMPGRPWLAIDHDGAPTNAPWEGADAA